tara:strand:+ start:3926 stop:4420 length:495 start_codon:yes stop_codon:yes gene_type:complete
MNKKTEFKIRKATVKDVSEILKLIKELADYEGLLDEVVANEELLKETLFGEKSYAEVILAYNRKEVLGFALYFYSFSTFLGRPGIYLEDFFVRESERERGIGKALLSNLAKQVREFGGGRLDWSVLEWNKRSINYYEKLGAYPLKEWKMYRLAGEKLNNLSQGV